MLAARFTFTMMTPRHRTFRPTPNASGTIPTQPQPINFITNGTYSSDLILQCHNPMPPILPRPTATAALIIELDSTPMLELSRFASQGSFLWCQDWHIGEDSAPRTGANISMPIGSRMWVLIHLLEHQPFELLFCCSCCEMYFDDMIVLLITNDGIPLHTHSFSPCIRLHQSRASMSCSNMGKDMASPLWPTSHERHYPRYCRQLIKWKIPNNHRLPFIMRQ